MSSVQVEQEQVQVQYADYFRDPVFQVVWDPAALCRNLLKNFKPYGAEIRGLTIHPLALQEAYVSCHLPSAGTARVTPDRFDLFIAQVQDEAQVEGLIESGWSAMADTDDSISTVAHELIVTVWVRFSDTDFGSYIRRFVTSPVGHWQPTVQFRHADGYSLRLEESAKAPGGLCMESIVRIDSSSELSVSELMSQCRDRLKEQLRVAGLDIHLRV